ncbi:MAG: integrin alpha [Planctomycetota bacterium]
MNGGDHFGTAITSTSDFDGDSMPDFLIGSSEEYQGIAGQGMVYVISAVNGQTIMTFPPLVQDQSQLFGGSLTTLPDIDGDQLEELVVGAPGFGSGSTYGAGAVEARLSGSGTALWRVEGSIQFGRLGAELHRVPDLDQDGYPEIVVYQELLNTTDDPRLIVLSGMDGRVLWEFKGVSPYSGFGIGMGSFDRNGDGLPELFVGEPYYGIGWPGRVLVLSLTPFLFNEGELSLSASTQGELRFQLDFPSSEAGLPFAVLASSSGPGSFHYGGVGIPLAMDSTLQRTYRNPPPSFQGTLDGDGNHLVVTRIPTGSLASFVGTTMHFAAVTLVGGQPSLSSVAVPIEVLP